LYNDRFREKQTFELGGRWFMKTRDVYSFGVVSSSTLYGIQGTFPAPEGYAPTSRW
jgi:hypothetical protein